MGKNQNLVKQPRHIDLDVYGGIEAGISPPASASRRVPPV